MSLSDDENPFYEESKSQALTEEMLDKKLEALKNNIIQEIREIIDEVFNNNENEYTTPKKKNEYLTSSESEYLPPKKPKRTKTIDMEIISDNDSSSSFDLSNEKAKKKLNINMLDYFG